MAVPKNKLSFVSGIVSEHYEEGTNPLNIEFTMNNDSFEVLPRHIVNFYMESGIVQECITI